MGMKSQVKYNGALHALVTIARTEGLQGLYRGIFPNLRAFSSDGNGSQCTNPPAVKVAPSIATSFFVRVARVHRFLLS